jgi:prepilin-type processing-associated H-X9-DG protein
MPISVAALLLPLLNVWAAPPEDTIKALAELWNTKNLADMVPYYKGADPKAKFDMLSKAFGPSWPTLTVSDVSVTVNGTKGEMKCHVSITIAGQAAQAIDDAAEMELNGDVWQVVPQAASTTPRVFGAIGMIITQPKMIETSRNAAKTTMAVSNLKQIALASQLLASDNDDKFKINPASVHKSLAPYLKNERIWLDPVMNRSDVYSFNVKLKDVDLGKLEAPSETILFYVGRKGEFEFPYKGRTIIAYADGHVKIVTAAQAKLARWKP